MAYNVNYTKRPNKFQFYVTWVDQNLTVNDDQKTPILSKISPGTGRNLHIGGFKLNQREGGNIILHVLVPQDILGSFKMPQIGDIVWIEEDNLQQGSIPFYVYSTYNNGSEDNYGVTRVPLWGSMAGDYGHLRSYKDHNKQFSSKVNSNFIKKYVKSITGYRFRSYYASSLKAGKFSVRGDPVFDINPKLNDENVVIDNGLDIGYGETLTKNKQVDYPNPLNVPQVRDFDENYSYSKLVPAKVGSEIELNPYVFESELSNYSPGKTSRKLKTKNYFSYQPILDKSFLEEVEFEREVPAAEEYQVALRGNNKLLIQDQHGDGEQLLITLKNQYDAGFTIVQNGDRGQVRIRDHLGQGMLMESNPDAPRVMTWTSANQKIEQGHVPATGSYTYIRNGEVFGDSDTKFGKKTNLGRNDIPNQEFLMVSSSAIVSEIQDKISEGMASVLGAASAPGIFMRNNVDPNLSEQTHSIYNTYDSLVYETNQYYNDQEDFIDDSNPNWTQQTSRKQQLIGGDRNIDTFEMIYAPTGVASGSSPVPTRYFERKVTGDGSVVDGLLFESEMVYNDESKFSRSEKIDENHDLIKTSLMDYSNGVSKIDFEEKISAEGKLIESKNEKIADNESHFLKENYVVDADNNISKFIRDLNTETGAKTFSFEESIEGEVITKKTEFTNGTEFVTDSEVINGSDDVVKTSVVESSSSKVEQKSVAGSVPEFFVKTYIDNNIENSYELLDSEIKTVKYSDGSEVSTLTQSDGDFSLQRNSDTVTINIGADNNDGLITIGNSASNIFIDGAEVEMKSENDFIINSGANTSVTSSQDTSISSVNTTIDSSSSTEIITGSNKLTVDSGKAEISSGTSSITTSNGTNDITGTTNNINGGSNNIKGITDFSQ